MKRTFFALLIVLGATQCTWTHSLIDRIENGENPYLEDPYYVKYLNTGSRLDDDIRIRLAALAENPNSPALHNELGALLVEKRLSNDAVTEFRRAIANDGKFYPAWYNLGQVLEARGDFAGAENAYEHTVDVKPGHDEAHFRLGLILERRGARDAAVDHYAKAIRINRQILDVRTNPRVLDSQLLDLAVLEVYPAEHARTSAKMIPTPAGYVEPVREIQGASPEAKPEEIVTPAPAPTDPAAQPPRPKG